MKHCDCVLIIRQWNTVCPCVNQTMQLLLERGARQNVRDINGDSPLHICSASGFCEGVRLLLQVLICFLFSSRLLFLTETCEAFVANDSCPVCHCRSCRIDTCLLLQACTYLFSVCHWAVISVRHIVIQVGQKRFLPKTGVCVEHHKLG